MTVHWKINGISACRSPLTYAALKPTVCMHKDRDDPMLASDIAGFRAVWGETDTIEVVDGPCRQQDWVCHCEEPCDCDERMALSPELEQEHNRQISRYQELQKERSARYAERDRRHAQGEVEAGGDHD